ncbi:hypothetical protein TNCT_315551 [Trichonephila clavata]|uniref:Uncharacterized protein n=1 Tax=Trichonephila clavata TaxID=2740835 RepID=A0A8X6GZ83_TRICU|nr:hypothetical protein TNCT_315551 [Trichonephila clavata]
MTIWQHTSEPSSMQNIVPYRYVSLGTNRFVYAFYSTILWTKSSRILPGVPISRHNLTAKSLNKLKSLSDFIQERCVCWGHAFGCEILWSAERVATCTF